MRTQDEIVARIHAVENDDWMGTTRGDLIEHLDWNHAKPWLKPEATREQWEQRDTKGPAAAMLDYLPFAFGKALDHRGLSAGRSVDHLSAWAWLISDDAHRYIIEIPNYPSYGMPHLWAAAQWLKADPVDFAGTDQSAREAAMRMAVGEPCRPDCLEGC